MLQRLTAALVALTFALTVAACGDDSSSDATGAGEGGNKANAGQATLDCDRTLTADEVLNYPVPKADERYDITLMLVSLAGYYYQGQGYGAQQAAKEAGVDLSVVATQGFATAAQQIRQAENVLTKGTDAIILSPADVEGSVPIVEQATKRDVPVIDIGTLVDSPDATKIVQDDYRQGQAAADALAEQLPDGGPGIIMGGPANATWATNRVAGFQDRIAEKHPKIEIADVTNSLVDPGEGLVKFTNATSANPNVEWIYATYNLLLPPDSIPEQFKDAVYVAGAYDPITEKALTAGNAQAVVPDWPIYMGRVGLAEAVETLNGDSPPKLTCFPSPVITAQNRSSEIAKAQLFPPGFKVSN